jgi:predicted ATPase
MLVIVDNAEHVLDSVIELSQWLMRAFTEMRIIITSRRMIPGPSVQIWEIGPLTLDNAEDVPDAIELFLRRARVSCPNLDLSGELPAVGKLRCWTACPSL